MPHLRIEVTYLSTAAIALVDLEGRYAGWLGPEELQAFSRLVRDDDRLEYLAAHVLVRIGLASSLACEPQEVEIAYESNGRPFVVGSRIPFSLSHCRGLAACAFSSDGGSTPPAVGVDVEPLAASSRMPEVAAMLVAEGEGEWIEASDDANTAMLRLWTVKEAVLKARGTGFQTGKKTSPFLEILCNEPVVVRDGPNKLLRYTTQDGMLIESWEVAGSHLLSLARFGGGTDLTVGPPQTGVL